MKVQFHLAGLSNSKGIIVEWASEHVSRVSGKFILHLLLCIKRCAAVSHCFSNLSHNPRKQGTMNPSLNRHWLLITVYELTPCIFTNMQFLTELRPLVYLSCE